MANMTGKVQLSELVKKRAPPALDQSRRGRILIRLAYFYFPIFREQSTFYSLQRNFWKNSEQKLDTGTVWHFSEFCNIFICAADLEMADAVCLEFCKHFPFCSRTGSRCADKQWCRNFDRRFSVAYLTILSLGCGDPKAFAKHVEVTWNMCSGSDWKESLERGAPSAGSGPLGMVPTC